MTELLHILGGCPDHASHLNLLDLAAADYNSIYTLLQNFKFFKLKCIQLLRGI